MYISYPSGMWKVKLLRNYNLVPVDGASRGDRMWKSEKMAE
jgi:hypothetical protein